MTLATGHRGKLREYAIHLFCGHFLNSNYMSDTWGWSRYKGIKNTVFALQRQCGITITTQVLEYNRLKFKSQLCLLIASMQF